MSAKTVASCCSARHTVHRPCVIPQVPYDGYDINQMTTTYAAWHLRHDMTGAVLAGLVPEWGVGYMPSGSSCVDCVCVVR